MTGIYLNCLWYIAILATIWICKNEWIVLKKLLELKINTCSHFTVCKKMINITRGVMVIVVGNGHGDTSLNPGQGW